MQPQLLLRINDEVFDVLDLVGPGVYGEEVPDGLNQRIPS